MSSGDLTTVYLGGALVTGNLAERVVVERSPTEVQLSRTRAGYLEVEDFAFLLALQLRARDVDEATVHRIGKFLGSAQRYCFERSWRALPLSAPALRERLGIPDHAGNTTRAIPPALPAQGPTRWLRPWGRTAYASRRSRATQGLLIGLAVGFFAMAMIRNDWGFVVWAALPLLFALGGRLLPKLRCSKCRTVLSPSERECPGCAAFILGTLHHPPPAFDVGEHRRTHVNRVPGHRGKHYSLWLGTAGVLLGLVPVGLSGTFSYTWLGCVGAIVGSLYGRRHRLDTCGGEQCEAPLEPMLRTCPRCLGELR